MKRASRAYPKQLFAVSALLAATLSSVVLAQTRNNEQIVEPVPRLVQSEAVLTPSTKRRYSVV